MVHEFLASTRNSPSGFYLHHINTVKKRSQRAISALLINLVLWNIYVYLKASFYNCEKTINIVEELRMSLSISVILFLL